MWNIVLTVCVIFFAITAVLETVIVNAVWLYQVLRATDDCTTVLARVIDTKLCINILNPLSDMAECPMNLAAIKMEEKVIRSATEPVTRAILERVVPTLIKVCCLRRYCNCYCKLKTEPIRQVFDQ